MISNHTLKTEKIFIRFYVVVNYYLLSLSFKFHGDPCTNARARVIHARTHDKMCARVYTSCTRICVWIFAKFQGCLQKVLRKSKGFFKEASRVFQGGFRGISMVFQESFKGSRLKGVTSNFKVGSWVERSLKGLSGKFQCCFNAFSKVPQWCFQEVSRKFQEGFKKI